MKQQPTTRGAIKRRRRAITIWNFSDHLPFCIGNIYRSLSQTAAHALAVAPPHDGDTSPRGLMWWRDAGVFIAVGVEIISLFVQRFIIVRSVKRDYLLTTHCTGVCHSNCRRQRGKPVYGNGTIREYDIPFHPRSERKKNRKYVNNTLLPMRWSWINVTRAHYNIIYYILCV